MTPPIGNDLSTLTWLNDIVVDLKNGFAYMSNSNGKGGIVVYDYTNNRARQFTDPTTGAEGIESVDFCGSSASNANVPTRQCHQERP